MVYLLYTTGLIKITRIVVGYTFLYSAYLALFVNFKSKNPVILALSFFALFSVLIVTETSTLNSIFISLLSFLVAHLYFKGKHNLLLKFTGIIPFLLIIVIIIFGIYKYADYQLIHYPNKTISSWSGFSSWVKYKFFFDRAPYWAGGYNQIMEYKHLLPISDIPDILTRLPGGNKIEVTFGSHTSVIELIRKYGIIAGVILNVCLIFIVVKSRKILTINNLYKDYIPLFSTAIVSTILLTLAGQYHLMPGYSLMTLGIMGIGYSHYYCNLHLIN